MIDTYLPLSWRANGNYNRLIRMRLRMLRYGNRSVYERHGTKCSQHTQIPRLTLRVSPSEMLINLVHGPMRKSNDTSTLCSTLTYCLSLFLLH
jgi:hypothetical protein